MITKNDLCDRLLKAEYAVRGAIVMRAQQLEGQGRHIVYCNIGNPQEFGQKPLTFIRQMLCLLEYPVLLEDPHVAASFPKDIVQRVKHILQIYPHGTGAYSHSGGIPFVRKAVADFVAKRDGISANPGHIILIDGASKGVQAVLIMLLRNPSDGFMVPVPQYPLYSASLTLYGGKRIDYYLNESEGWQLDEQMLIDSYDRAVNAGIHPVGLVVINPGNPTGAVLKSENIEMIVRFCAKRKLSILADEVYQENTYRPDDAFHSFAKVMHQMGDTKTTLFSVHSVSKGFLGECGHRGGYLEMRNIPEDVVAEFVKLQSISLCSNLVGQFVTYAMVAPPQPGDESYELYVRERDAVRDGLKEKALLLWEGINRIDGMYMHPPTGAMYAFVRFELPDEPGVNVDEMDAPRRYEYESKRNTEYCMKLLEETGICVVPGVGFGQLSGTMHFRITFLPPRDQIEPIVESLAKFHKEYCEKIRNR